MHVQDLPSDQENQFPTDVCAFISETIPGTGIKLLRPKPETEAALTNQLDIKRRLELLRRQAPAPAHLTAPRLLQDVALVGVTSDGASVHLVITVVVEPPRWSGGWFIGVVPPDENETWQAYLASAREQFVLEVSRGVGLQL
jgi:hypothetical protein